MESLNSLVNQLNGLVWGPPMLVMILGTGWFLWFPRKSLRFSKTVAGFNQICQGRLQ